MPIILTSPGGTDLYRGDAPVTLRSPAVTFNEEDYLRALQALLPRGRAWPREPEATLTRTLRGFAAAFTTSDAAAKRLLVAAFPATAADLLPEWEAALGLPGPFGLAGTTQGRQAEIVAALINTGGQSKAHFIALAAALGIAITVTEYRPFNVNGSVDEGIASDDWAHTWQVNAPLTGASAYGTTPGVVQTVPGFGNAALEYVLGRGCPAHTVCVTLYS